MPLYFISTMSIVDGQPSAPVQIGRGALGQVIPRKGDIVKLPVSSELAAKIRADVDNPKFEVKDVEFDYEGTAELGLIDKDPTVTVYVLAVGFHRPAGDC